MIYKWERRRTSSHLTALPPLYLLCACMRASVRMHALMHANVGVRACALAEMTMANYVQC